uniref:Uncharacterized protein n=1 Tax=Bursaphelenchus xylophilus TaxID=6326 RepID=A0A1I7SNT1_BURXY
MEHSQHLNRAREQLRIRKQGGFRGQIQLKLWIVKIRNWKFAKIKN